MTRLAYLESALRALRVEGLTLEFRPFRGWYLCGEPRWFGDDGADWIGANWREAEKELAHLFPIRAAA